jgi:hypothetical protein
MSGKSAGRIHYADARLDGVGSVLRSACGQARFFVGDEFSAPALRQAHIERLRCMFFSSEFPCARCVELLERRGMVSLKVGALLRARVQAVRGGASLESSAELVRVGVAL